MRSSTPLSLVVATMCTLLASACAGDSSRYPSLAIRDAERISGSFGVATPPEAQPNPVSLPGTQGPELEQLPRLLETARAAHARFLDAAPGARNSVLLAQGSNVDDNRWSSAQIALAELDSLRSESAIPLGDLDRLHAEAGITFSESASIDSAREEVIGLIAEQDSILADLRGRMPR